LASDNLVPVPDGIESAEAVSLVLNYVTAYQMLHRAVEVKAGDKILITGAAGGVGSAMLQLGKIAGLEMYGTASKSKHTAVRDLGGFPIDYKTEDFVKIVKQQTEQGVDYAFDAVGGSNVWKAYRALRPKGTLISYGASSGVKNGKSQNIPAFATFGILGAIKIIPDGKKANFYGITAIFRKNPVPFKEDLPKLFQLLAEGKIKPLIADKLPFLEARRANEILEKGTHNGKIVLLCQE
jgi:NADPH2:quinone reductase